ncbi:hypothetical protein GCM10010365_68410 [Streptomyces poonensis]|uniref:Uncharacterized protein n=1 Tax=Streptomyces poonensis TaxID=68255 RepID=A0A918Q8K3_9ACTN|nr:hypothetical protein GCM10010365_68410 [Streptomyces poonensis]GLJ91099.1 hypothetical protein GCM10017589_37050 [Streptomyces poonensis]
MSAVVRRGWAAFAVAVAGAGMVVVGAGSAAAYAPGGGGSLVSVKNLEQGQTYSAASPGTRTSRTFVYRDRSALVDASNARQGFSGQGMSPGVVNTDRFLGL